jgi:hypothetical protein
MIVVFCGGEALIKEKKQKRTIMDFRARFLKFGAELVTVDGILYDNSNKVCENSLLISPEFISFVFENYPVSEPRPIDYSLKRAKYSPNFAATPFY